MKTKRFLGEFRKYRLSKKQVANLVGNKHGLLACKVSNFVGFFDYIKSVYGMPAKDVVKILDDFPELALQNRRHLIVNKTELIKDHMKYKT